jgi:hypothetical protein
VIAPFFARREHRAGAGGELVTHWYSVRMRIAAAMFIVFAIAAVARAAETFAPEPKSGWPTVSAAYPADGAQNEVLGKLALSGGQVTLLVSRNQNRLVLDAHGADGSRLGRAETVVGIGDTTLYIRSLRGLLKVVIHWKSISAA